MTSTTTSTTTSADGRPLTVLVTGANKGLGKETARQLVAAGHTVYLAARDADRGRHAAAEIGARPIVLDVTDAGSIAAAATQVRTEAGHLDVLINNAGFTGDLGKAAAEVDADEMLAVYDTNVFGTVRVTRAFLPLLDAADTPAVVNVSSGMGSGTRVSDPQHSESRWPSIAYASSKSAINMLTIQYAKSFPAIRVHAVDPGLTATDGTSGMGKSVEEGVRAIVTAVLHPEAAPSGGFTDSNGPVPW